MSKCVIVFAKWFQAITIMIATATAFAQPDWNQSRDQSDQTQQDFDYESEQHSEFWERILYPNRKYYQKYLDATAPNIWRQNSAARRDLERALKQAIAIDPSDPRAYWFLSIVHEQRKDWANCIKRRKQVIKLDPDFEPPKIYEVSTSAMEGLALCLHFSGQFEESSKQFARLQRAKAPDPGVGWRLGEAYMALGRLRQAITTFETMARHTKYRQKSLLVALAIAHDRNGNRGSAKAYLSKVRRATNFATPGRFQDVAPASDRFYYAAMLNQQFGYLAHATVLFRRYLSEDKLGLWHDRAKQHLREISQMVPKHSFVSRGISPTDRPKLAKVINAATNRAQKCLAKTPGVLVTVSLAFPGQGEKSTISTTAQYSLASETHSIQEARRCVENIVSNLTLPKPKHRASARFGVAAR